MRCGSSDASSEPSPCFVATVTKHRHNAGQTSSQRWPNIVTLVAMHRHDCGHASSRLWPCIVTAFVFKGTPDMKVNESEKFTFIVLVV